jgi:hypothetical protein
MGDERMAGSPGGSYTYGQPSSIEVTPIWNPGVPANAPVNPFTSKTSPRPLPFDFRTTTPAAATNPVYVRDLRYGDPNLDFNLERNTDAVLRLNGVPSEVTVMYWANAEGQFFFYFKDKGGEETEAPHYIPATARQISINGASLIDLDQKRNRVASMLMQDVIAREIESGGSGQNEALVLAILKKNIAVQGGNPNLVPEFIYKLGFCSLTGDDRTGGVSRLSWLLALSFDQLSVQEMLLKDSSNPTSRVWLADIRYALAIKLVLNEGGNTSDNSQALAYLRDALDLVASAQIDCMAAFLRLGKTPDKETEWPFDPFDVTPYGSYGWSFYAGSYDQGRLRAAAFRWFYNAILKQAPWEEILKKLGLEDLPRL